MQTPHPARRLKMPELDDYAKKFTFAAMWEMVQGGDVATSH